MVVLQPPALGLRAEPLIAGEQRPDRRGVRKLGRPEQPLAVEELGGLRRVRRQARAAEARRRLRLPVRPTGLLARLAGSLLRPAGALARRSAGLAGARVVLGGGLGHRRGGDLVRGAGERDQGRAGECGE
ncbi:hypothetical protein ACIBTZ_12655 [Micromonospora sp. NPDC049460]|uniref:hypothetical protein n=1 Tax=Micromonospora sp. NPDC049460 TaxID=3364272 RepID=UPI0037AC9FDD